jgi:hypothetical protein
MSTSPAEFNAKVIDEFRANEGRVDGMFESIAGAVAASHRRELIGAISSDRRRGRALEGP